MASSIFNPAGRNPAIPDPANPPLELAPVDGRTAQQQRILELAGRLKPGNEDRGLVLEVCAAFDLTAEFAACEGRSIVDALAEFFSEAEPPDTRWGQVQASLRKLLNWDDVRGEKATELLPVMPSAAMKLLRIHEETATVGQLESVAASDPVMAGRILSVANSARFGSRYEVSAVADAIQRVGIPEARKTLLAACFSGLFASRTLQDLWAHSQLVADLSWQFAGMCGVDRGAAYSAGLLHDIGRLVLLCGSSRLQAAEWSWVSAGFPLIYAESLVRARDHATSGADLLITWKLPEELVEAVRLHHRPESSKSMLTHVLFLAEDMTAMLEEKPAEDLWSPMRRQICLDRAGIAADGVKEILAAFDGQELRRVC